MTLNYRQGENPHLPKHNHRICGDHVCAARTPCTYNYKSERGPLSNMTKGERSRAAIIDSHDSIGSR